MQLINQNNIINLCHIIVKSNNTNFSDFGSYVIRIENLPCSPNSTIGCQADVYLERILIPGQAFQFRITVRDTRGDTTTVPVRLVATEARSDVENIFPHIPAIIIVPEVHISEHVIVFSLFTCWNINFFDILCFATNLCT